MIEAKVYHLKQGQSHLEQCLGVYEISLRTLAVASAESVEVVVATSSNKRM